MNGIEKFKNVIDEKLCKKLITYLEDNIEIAYDMKHSNEQRNNVICKQLYVPDHLDKEVMACIHIVAEQYAKLYNWFGCSGDVGYQLRRISGNTLIHADGVWGARKKDIKEVRTVSIILGLNSNYEKGEFNFPNQNYKTTVKQGEAICFPVYFMYPHEVSAPKGYRYTINTWLTE